MVKGVSKKGDNKEKKSIKRSRDVAKDIEETNSSSSEYDSELESEIEEERPSKKARVEEESDEDDIPTTKSNAPAQKKSSTSSDAFSSAVNALLGTHLKAHDRTTPILARSKQISKKLESDKLEQKAKRVILAEKKSRLTASHKTQILPQNDEEAREVLEHERKLRKVAQRGVIKLFNVIMMTQHDTQEEVERVRGRGILGDNKRKELVNEISKDKFLDLVQQAGKSQ